MSIRIFFFVSGGLAAQHGAHTCHELAQGERLENVVVGAGVEGVDDGCRGHVYRACDNSDGGGVTPLFYLFHNVKTRILVNVEVYDHQRVFRQVYVVKVVHRGAYVHHVAFRKEVCVDEFSYMRVAVNYYYAATQGWGEVVCWID